MLRVQMEWQDWYGAKSAFQGNPRKTCGRRVEHYGKQWSDRPELHERDRFIIATRFRSRLNKAGSTFFSLFSEKLPGQPVLSFLSVSL